MSVQAVVTSVPGRREKRLEEPCPLIAWGALQHPYQREDSSHGAGYHTCRGARGRPGAATRGGGRATLAGADGQVGLAVAPRYAPPSAPDPGLVPRAG